MTANTVLINPREPALGTANVILRGKGRQHFVDNYPGPLSIKCVIRGQGIWKTEDGAFRVDERTLLVVNDRQPYTLTIDSRQPVSTCCLFFERGFVESIHHSAARPLDQSLDQPARRSESRQYLVRLQAGRTRLLSDIREIDAAISAGLATETWLEEKLLDAAHELLALDRHAALEQSRVPAAKPSTREEAYRRLRRGQEFLHAHLDQPVSLQEAARASCLSIFHFHRLFTEAFHETPHQYLTRLRLDRAAHLLTTSEIPVTEICLASGFSSLGSFSTLFRKQHGCSPREFRNRKIQEVSAAHKP